MSKVKPTIAIIGGGAAGFFAAINLDVSPMYSVVILEKSNKLLSKVKISGGGRCNVTHSCFDPKELTAFYPRGKKELRGPFSQFQPADTFDWFLKRGVDLKTEKDNRVFPTTDSSQTIIDCFLRIAEERNISIRSQSGVVNIERKDNLWKISLSDQSELEAEYVIVAAGSSPQFWDFLKTFGLEMSPQIPSLFTFNIDDERLKHLAGLSVPNGLVCIPSLNQESWGPVLITHWGISGPGVLKLSSLAATELFRLNYSFEVVVNWVGIEQEELIELFKELRIQQPKKNIHTFSPIPIPIRLWNSLINKYISEAMKWADVSNELIRKMAIEICACKLNVSGKSTFKDEFVTAGGVDLKEIDFKTMESKRFSKIYFAGEVLNIDALTGGFNFQAAWTTSWIAAQHISSRIKKSD